MIEIYLRDRKHERECKERGIKNSKLITCTSTHYKGFIHNYALGYGDKRKKLFIINVKIDTEFSI